MKNDKTRACLNGDVTVGGYPGVTPWQLGGNSSHIAPDNCPVCTSYFLVDHQFDLPYFDGEDTWYLADGRSVKAGEPFSNLFEG